MPQRKLSNSQLRHDIRGELSVLGLGLEALTNSRNDDAQFEELIVLLRDNVEAIRTNVEVLVARAERQ